MSFTDGQTTQQKGRFIKAIDFCPGTVTEDQKCMIWDQGTQSFKFVTPASLVLPITEAQVTNLVADLAACEKTANKGAANGYAGLNAAQHLTNALDLLSQIPQTGGVNGNVLTIVGGVVSWAGAATSLSEVQFLQGQAALGKLIMVTGSAAAPAANAVIASYTPANGTTFVLYESVCNVNAQPTAGTTAGLSLRNNGTVRSTIGCQYSTLAGLNSAMNKFPVKGDQLVGTGALVYDVINVNAITAGTVYASICGYLL